MVAWGVVELGEAQFFGNAPFQHRQRHMGCQAGEPAGDSGFAQNHFQVNWKHRQPLLRVAVKLPRVPVELPETSFREPRRGLR